MMMLPTSGGRCPCASPSSLTSLLIPYPYTSIPLPTHPPTHIKPPKYVYLSLPHFVHPFHVPTRSIHPYPSAGHSPCLPVPLPAGLPLTLADGSLPVTETGGKLKNSKARAHTLNRVLPCSVHVYIKVEGGRSHVIAVHTPWSEKRL